jgi:kinesin family protein 11
MYTHMYVCIYICAHTQGTLDYACRAKNIKNTPEINQVQTKKTMMRDMSKYIADLQEQLKAQRDGTGVYLPNGKYEEMQAELKRLSEAEQLMQMELDEKLKQYQEMQDLFDDTRLQLQDTRSELQHTHGVLQETQQTLSDTQVTLHKTLVNIEGVLYRI